VKSKYQKIKGTFDILPPETQVWQHIESIVHKICKQFSFEEIRTPAIESIDLFKRNIGNETDVSKEMFAWKDQSEKEIALKPEMTAPVVRAYIESGFFRKHPLCRLYYIDSFFRREKPQKGRQRQFNQFGVEAFGTKNSEQDAEIILIAHQILKKLNIKNTNLSINNIGDSDTRSKYESKLKTYFNDHKNNLSQLSQTRLEKNPMRILDSKEKEDEVIIQNAPLIIDLLSKEEKTHFKSMLKHLDALGIKYNENPYLVRGLDYYNSTTFEITTQSQGSQNALCGGGRYDLLVEKMGGPKTPAVGFAAGIERIILEAKQELSQKNIDVYISCNNEEYTAKGFNIINELIENGYTIFFDTNKKNVKNQIKDAVKNNITFMLIIDEAITAKNLISKKEKSVSESEILNFLKDQ